MCSHREKKKLKVALVLCVLTPEHLCRLFAGCVQTVCCSKVLDIAQPVKDI